jgi:hypothetical protein
MLSQESSQSITRCSWSNLSLGQLCSGFSQSATRLRQFQLVAKTNVEAGFNQFQTPLIAANGGGCNRQLLHALPKISERVTNSCAQQKNGIFISRLGQINVGQSTHGAQVISSDEIGFPASTNFVAGHRSHFENLIGRESRNGVIAKVERLAGLIFSAKRS